MAENNGSSEKGRGLEYAAATRPSVQERKLAYDADNASHAVQAFVENRRGAPTGRPRKIKTPQEFDDLVNAHVLYCAQYREPLTWTGMALALGLTSRQALDRYGRDYGKEFSDSVKRARFLVENSYEKRLHHQSPTGAIFALKNMNWQDQTVHDHRSGDGSMSPRPLSGFYGGAVPPGAGEAPPEEADDGDEDSGC